MFSMLPKYHQDETGPVKNAASGAAGCSDESTMNAVIVASPAASAVIEGMKRFMRVSLP